MQIFLDESGDLGWSFDLPNGNGGSSRFITIAGVVVEEAELKHVKRYIADLYRKYNLTPKIEKKGCNFSDNDACYITTNLCKLIEKAPSFRMIAITARKENVLLNLRKDCNIFYNYMLSVLLPDTFKHINTANLVLDKRTIKVDHGNNFEAYIKTKCWGDLGMDIEISCQYDSSDKNEGIWMADWIANWIWRKYEFNQDSAYKVMKSMSGTHFFEKTLFMKGC
jgi:hypothetical protein